MNHDHPIGAQVDVRFATGFCDGTFRRSGWYRAEVVGHTAIGHAHREGGWPTYAVRMWDGSLVAHAAPECLRRRRGGS